jgi:hypothetical protein
VGSYDGRFTQFFDAIKAEYPITTNVDGLGANFTRTFPLYSITGLQMKGR